MPDGWRNPLHLLRHFSTFHHFIWRIFATSLRVMPWQKRAILELSLKTALVIGKVRDLYPDMFQEDFLSCQRTENTSVIQMLWYSPSPANPLCYLRAKINSHILFIQLTGLGDEQMLFWSAFFVCVSLFFFFQYACDVQAEVVGKPAKMFFWVSLSRNGSSTTAGKVSDAVTTGCAI